MINKQLSDVLERLGRTREEQLSKKVFKSHLEKERKTSSLLDDQSKIDEEEWFSLMKIMRQATLGNNIYLMKGLDQSDQDS